jgi:hypothetical protein
MIGDGSAPALGDKIIAGYHVPSGIDDESRALSEPEVPCLSMFERYSPAGAGALTQINHKGHTG